MLKLFGTIILSFSVWLVGTYKSKRLKHKMDVEDGLLAILEYIKRTIKTQNLALSDIYRSAADDCVDLPQFFEKLHEGKYNSFRLALDTISDKECDKNICEYAKSFAESVGASFCAEEAVVMCDKSIELMKMRISIVRQEDKKREGLYSKLGFLGACAVFVLCI